MQSVDGLWCEEGEFIESDAEYTPDVIDDCNYIYYADVRSYITPIDG
jgi:hypothetical protein